MKDIMVDLETLGTVPGCAILSIGAVAFDELGVSSDGFYIVVDCADQADLHTDPSTEAWWKAQSPEARKVIEEVERGNGTDVIDALTDFNDFIVSVHPDARIWGNGADFDNAILAVAYRLCGVKPGWRPYNGRCYRTVKNQFRDIKLARSGTYHNALDDARSQAQHLVEICLKRGWKLA